MGTFFVNAGKFGDREIAGAFFKNGPQLCTFKIKRETLKPEVTYSIMESNSCKGSNPVIRKSPSQSQTK